MTIEWNKVTWYSKIVVVIIFVGTFFLGFWLGTMKTEKVYVEVPHLVAHTTTSQVESIRQNGTSTLLFSKQETRQKSTEEAYKILAPHAGNSFPEDTPIVVAWESSNNSKFVNIYLLPDTCTDNSCDDIYKNTTLGTQFPFHAMIEEYAPDNGSYRFSLPDLSPYTAYPEGRYRIVLRRSSEALSLQTFLAVSEPFLLSVPKDHSRVHRSGDKAGDFIIASANAYGMQTIGTTTVRGLYWGPDGILQGFDCFTVISEDAWKIPDARPSFCFSNDVPDELRKSEGTTTIQIANFLVDARPIETVNSADFVRIVH